MNKINPVVCALLFLVLTTACSMMKDSKAAEPAVEKFHTQFNANQFSEIYNESGDTMKKMASEKELTDLLDAVYRKLGTYQKSTSTRWHVDGGPVTSIVNLSYDTEFSDGKAAEQFTFSVSGDTVKLEGYHINSNELITK